MQGDMGSEGAIPDGMAPKAASCALTRMPAEQDHDEIVNQACKKLNRLMLPFALLFRSAAAALSEACGHARLLMLSNSLTCVYTAVQYYRQPGQSKPVLRKRMHEQRAGLHSHGLWPGQW